MHSRPNVVLIEQAAVCGYPNLINNYGCGALLATSVSHRGAPAWRVLVRQCSEAAL